MWNDDNNMVVYNKIFCWWNILNLRKDLMKCWEKKMFFIRVILSQLTASLKKFYHYPTYLRNDFQCLPAMPPLHWSLLSLKQVLIYPPEVRPRARGKKSRLRPCRDTNPVYLVNLVQRRARLFSTWMLHNFYFNWEKLKKVLWPNLLIKFGFKVRSEFTQQRY